MYDRSKRATVLLKVMLVRRLNEKLKRKTESKAKRRWGIRPVLRQRKHFGEFKSTFENYKIFDHEWFFLYTRMTPSQFDDLLQVVGPALTKKSHREPLSPAQRLAITLRYLSQGDSVFSIASGYKIGRSTASIVIRNTTEVIWDTLNETVLKALNKDNMKKISSQFLQKWNLPHTLGAIDGKHIAVQCPPNSGSEYFNYKKHFSVVLLALCDAHYNFTYVNVGAYGSQSDGGVLANSILGEALANESLPIPPNEFLPNSRIEMTYFFVSDDAFPLGKHLMKPYKGTNLTTEQNIFNYRLSRARRVIENCFGILVARWRIFTKTITAHPSTVDNIVKATACLHNFIKQKEYNLPESKRKYCSALFCDRETDNGILPGEWRQELQNGTVVLENIHKTGKGGNNPGKKALHLREQLTQYLISPAGALPGQIHYVNRGKRISQ